jgi:hypothetical protein
MDLRHTYIVAPGSARLKLHVFTIDTYDIAHGYFWCITQNRHLRYYFQPQNHGINVIGDATTYTITKLQCRIS